MAVSSSTNGADTPFADIIHFRSLIGALQYLAITRPDIQFAVNRVAQRMHQPSEQDYHCLKRILRYIFGTLGRGLLIRPGDLELRGFSDSDWANDKNDRKSTPGYFNKQQLPPRRTDNSNIKLRRVSFFLLRQEFGQQQRQQISKALVAPPTTT
uniref:Reverse transcriptase Ty1/copia-type domain-containing protein n=1 Tax=Solanum lycopersicum TaxID=4081 RepID=A0A3Q7GER5_SOLLC